MHRPSFGFDGDMGCMPAQPGCTCSRHTRYLCLFPDPDLACAPPHHPLNMAATSHVACPPMRRGGGVRVGL